MSDEPRFMEPVPGGFRIDEVQLTRIKLEPGEVLSIRIYSDNIDSTDMAMLKRQLTSIFPENRIMLFCMSKNDKMEIEVVSAPVEATAGDCSSPVDYCSSCSCGKKERIEAEKSNVSE
jgi:hypothetical protein